MGLRIYPDQELTEEMRVVFPLSMAANLASAIPCKQEGEEESAEDKERTCDEKIAKKLCGSLTTLNEAIQKIEDELELNFGEWQIVWGPVVQSICSDSPANVMYVAKRENQYVVAIAGTNGNSIFDAVAENMILLLAREWRYGGDKVNKYDPKPLISCSTDIGLQNLLKMQSTGFEINNGEDECKAVNRRARTLCQYFQDELQGKTGIEIIVTGHSQGGSLAAALGLFLKDTQKDWDLNDEGKPKTEQLAKVKVYSMAGPTPGNRSFARYFEDRFGQDGVRIWNDLDIVPYLADVDEALNIVTLYEPKPGITFFSFPFNHFKGEIIETLVKPLARLLTGHYEYKQIGSGNALTRLYQIDHSTSIQTQELDKFLDANLAEQMGSEFLTQLKAFFETDKGKEVLDQLCQFKENRSGLATFNNDGFPAWLNNLFEFLWENAAKPLIIEVYKRTLKGIIDGFVDAGSRFAEEAGYQHVCAYFKLMEMAPLLNEQAVQNFLKNMGISCARSISGADRYKNVVFKSVTTQQYVGRSNETDGWLTVDQSADDKSARFHLDILGRDGELATDDTGAYIRIKAPKSNYYWECYLYLFSGDNYYYYTKLNKPSDNLYLTKVSKTPGPLKNGDIVAFSDKSSVSNTRYYLDVRHNSLYLSNSGLDNPATHFVIEGIPEAEPEEVVS